jgi:hypothetical protein
MNTTSVTLYFALKDDSQTQLSELLTPNVHSNLSVPAVQSFSVIFKGTRGFRRFL